MTARPTSGSRRSASIRSASRAWARSRTSGRWATPARAVRAPRSSTTTVRRLPGGPPGSPDEDGDRYVEIWNLVFMQFDRSADGTMTPLPKPSVDTGMGLERVAAVMQGVHSNYDIDLFRNLIEAAAKATRTRDLQANSLRVIADHIRATSFLIADGVTAVERRPRLRAAPDHAPRDPPRLQARPAPAVLPPLVAPLEQEMGAAYPELVDAARAHRARDPARKRSASPRRSRRAWPCSTPRSAGSAARRRFPARPCSSSTTPSASRSTSPTTSRASAASAIDEPGFEAAMEAQRARARAASKFGVDLRGDVSVDTQTSFVGYDGEHGVGPRRRVVPRQGDASPNCKRRRGGAGGARRHAVLRRERRPGRRQRRARDDRLRASSQRHAEARQGAPARRQGCSRARCKVGDAVEAIVDGATRARRRDSITPPRTCCTRRCARCSARTSRRRARSSRPIACASTSRTIRR